MADCMMFPNDWHDFIKDYSFIDSEQVYTNGSELIQVFRVIQLIEHLLKEQEEREKKICKEICDFIRGSCSTDTYEDKEFVCHNIQKCFTEGR